MRSIRKFVALGSAILASTFVAMTASQADEFKTLTITKECSQFTGTAPSFCTITESNFRPLRGAIARYFGPALGANGFVDSWVVLEGTQGGTAFGHCLVRFAPAPLGACEFTGGSGSLNGFKADLTVTITSDGLWHWDGAMSRDD
jgi:hypothetical protein